MTQEAQSCMFGFVGLIKIILKLNQRKSRRRRQVGRTTKRVGSSLFANRVSPEESSQRCPSGWGRRPGPAAPSQSPRLPAAPGPNTASVM